MNKKCKNKNYKSKVGNRMFTITRDKAKVNFSGRKLYFLDEEGNRIKERAPFALVFFSFSSIFITISLFLKYVIPSFSIIFLLKILSPVQCV